MKQLLASLLLLGIGACGTNGGSETTTPSSTAPKTTSSTTTPTACAGSGTLVELGFPLQGGPVAEFTTKGGELRVTARSFPHGGIFDRDQGSTYVWIGPADRPPTYDPQKSVVTNWVEELDVNENEFTSVSLPPGRYWLWNSSGGDIVVESCEPGGVSDPVPVESGAQVRPPPAPATTTSSTGA